MTKDQIALIQELREEGYSLREIERETGIPKSSVELALKRAMAGVPSEPLEQDDEELDEPEDQDDEEPTIAVQGGTPDASRLPARSANPLMPSAAAQALLVDLATRREVAQQEEKRIQQRKDWFVSKTNRLIRELLTNAGKTTWDEGEVDDYILRVDVLKEKLFKFCEKHAIDEEGLQLWAVLTELVDFMNAHMEEHRPWLGSEVTFELSKEAIRSWKDNMIDSFEEEAYESDGDDDLDDEED